MDKAAYLDFIVEIVQRSDDHKGFEVLPRRWVVERTFGWMTRWRRLVRDYEARIDVSQAMIFVAMGRKPATTDYPSVSFQTDFSTLVLQVSQQWASSLQPMGTSQVDESKGGGMR